MAGGSEYLTGTAGWEHPRGLTGRASGAKVDRSRNAFAVPLRG
jgi:hypothetical protein